MDKNGANGANYSNKAADFVSDCVVGRANGTEHRKEAERLKSQSNIESWVSIAITAMDYPLPSLKEMEEGKPRDTMLQKLSTKCHQQKEELAIKANKAAANF